MKVLNSRGFSLVELMMSSGVSILIGIGLLTTLNFAVDRLNLVTEQLKAEESLAMASVYLTRYLSQAVKIRCCRGPGCANPGNDVTGGPLAAIPHPTYTQIPTGTEPAGIGEGVIDCRAGSTFAYVGGRQNAIALFTREVGMRQPSGVAFSTYRGAGIYFVPALSDAGMGASASGNNSGRLEFFDPVPGGPLANPMINDRLVSVAVDEPRDALGVPTTGVPIKDDNTPQGYLRSISFRLVARFFESSVPGNYHYRLPAPAIPHRDLSTVVTILFRNNRIGVSTLNGITSERPLGQLYFFKYFTPAIGGRE